jgi:BA14K-like protein
MKVTAILAALVVLEITSASAQVLLSGEYQCVQNCVGSGVAHVTQNGFELNLVNEVGQPSRAWIDYPGHIWVQYWNEGAVYTPDGMTIQFDRGSVWQRVVEPTPGVVAYCARRFKSYDPGSGTYLGYDGLRHPCP